MWRLASFALLALMLWGCDQPPPPDRLTVLPSSPLPDAGDPQSLDFVFLGTGGAYLRSGRHALLADPFFSNPPIADWVLLRPLQVRTEVIDRYLPPMDSVRGILVAHAHHDHAMDIPYIAGKVAPEVSIYGSDTLRNILYSAVDPQRLVSLNARAAGHGQSGEWVYLNESLRLLPISSGHAPHFMGKVFNSEAVTQPLAQLPQTVLDWQSGQALSFVLDFLEAGEPVFRVFYQSSAADEPDGVPPAWLLAESKGFDLALLGIANYGKLQAYPRGIVEALQPRHIVLLHWDVFWDDYSQTNTRPVPGLNLDALVQKLSPVLDPVVPVYLPQRGAHLRVQALSSQELP